MKIGRKYYHHALIGGLFLYLLAWGLRVAMVGVHRLHPDEALYGHWGLLILSGRDPWLATVPVYKPPLVPYILFGSMSLLGCDPFAPLQSGPSELAVRLPGLVAGMAMVGLTGRLAWRLYRDPMAGLTAAMVVALSPLAFLLSATGFTDPTMVVLGLAGCVAAAEGRPGWAGLLAGLSFAAKQTGVVWLPLVVLCGAIPTYHGKGPETTSRPSSVICHLSFAIRHSPFVISHLSFVISHFLLVAGLVLGWDRVRVAQGAGSFWRAGVTGYGGLRLAWPVELGTRLRAWLGWLRYLLGSPLLDALLVGGTAALVYRGVRRRDWAALFDLTLAGFCLLYLLLHWLWAFPVWDRYLLPLVPLVAVLLGRVVSALVRWATTRVAPTRRWWAGAVALLLVVVCLAVPAARAVAGQVPIGAGLAAYDGIEQVAGFLCGLPEGTVLYHHWLGWEYGFYLFDAPLYLAYWPTPAWLAQDVRVFGEAEPRYIVFPAWESSARVEAALADVGYRLEPALEVQGEGGEVRFRVFQVCKCASGRS